MSLKELWDTAVNEVSRVNEQLTDQIFSAPEAEVMVRKATNNELWGPSGTEMAKIADLTHHFTEYRQIMDALWSRLNEKNDGKNWRNVYKSLLLLEYILKNGSDRAISETRQRLFDLKMLGKFQYLDEKDVDRGLSIRERSKLVVDLAQDNDKLKEERKNAAKSRAKYGESISSESSNYRAGGGNQYRGGGGGGHGHGRSYDDFDPQPTPKRGFDFSSEEEVPAKEEWEPYKKTEPTKPVTTKPIQPTPTPTPTQPTKQIAQPKPTQTRQVAFDDDEQWGEFNTATPVQPVKSINPLDELGLVKGASLLGGQPTAPAPEKPKAVVDLLGQLTLSPTPTTLNPTSFGTPGSIMNSTAPITHSDFGKPGVLLNQSDFGKPGTTLNTTAFSTPVANSPSHQSPIIASTGTQGVVYGQPNYGVPMTYGVQPTNNLGYGVGVAQPNYGVPLGYGVQPTNLSYGYAVQPTGY